MRAHLLAVTLLSACGGVAPTAGPDASVAPDATTADASRPAGADAATLLDASAGSDDAGDPCSKPVQTMVKLEAAPATLQLVRGGQVEVTVRASFTSGCVREVTSVYAVVSDPLIAEVKTSADALAVHALANGTTVLTFSTEKSGGGVVSNAITVTVADPVTATTETRAVWVTRFAFHGDAATGTADIKGIIDRAKASHFNAIFFQVRGSGDAYYHSALEPSWGGGKGLGKDPGWDPLQVAVTYAHQQGLQLHAYLNAMSGWARSAGAIPDSTPQHVLKVHPEFTCKDSTGSDAADGEYTYIAADPAYRAFFADVVEDVLTHYDVDGIHLDRIRTPGSDYCHTPALDAAFKTAGGTWADFSRSQIDETVKAVYQRVLAKKPKALLSAAVWGVWKKPAGCTGSAGEGYSQYYQDSLGWAQKGFIDMLNPMIYWPVKPGACTDWAALADMFAAGMNGRQLVAGMTAARGAFPELATDIDYARQKKLAGTIVFASAYLDSSSLWDDYLAGPYQDAVQPAPMTHR